MADDVEGSGGIEQVDDFDPGESSLGQDAGAVDSDKDQAGAGEQGQDQQPAGELPEYLAQQLRTERLRPIAGETVEAASQRLYNHLSTKERNRVKEARTQVQAQAQQLAELRALMEPLAREHYNRARAHQTAELARQIPDREADPEGYRTWLMEQNLVRDEERRLAEAQAAEQWQLQQQQEEVRQGLEQTDEYGYTLLSQSLGLAEGSQADPEVVEAYDLLTQMGFSAARDYFPDAEDEEIAEFVALSQQLDIRRAIQNGIHPGEVLKRRVAPILARFSRQQTQTQPQHGGNGNGNGARGTVQQAANRIQNAPSPAAAKMAKDAAAAARRGPVSAPVVARPGSGAGLLDPASFEDEDDYVDAVLGGALGTFEDRVRGQRKER